MTKWGGVRRGRYKVKTGKHNVDYNTINQLWSSTTTHSQHLHLRLEILSTEHSSLL